MSFGHAASADNIDHCITNDGDRLVNLCDFRISVRYCCYGSEWYACDRSAKYDWGEDPGYHEWMEPGGRTGMACDPEKEGWRWAGCRLPDAGEPGEAAMGPYGWDMKSSRGLKCTDDAPSAMQDNDWPAMQARVRANVRSGPGTEYEKVGLLEAGEEVRVVGEAGEWLRIETAAGNEAFVHGSLLQEVGQEAAQEREDAEDEDQAALKEWCGKHDWVLNPETRTHIVNACIKDGKAIPMAPSEVEGMVEWGVCDSSVDRHAKVLLVESRVWYESWEATWILIEDSVFPDFVDDYMLEEIQQLEREVMEKCR